MKTLSIVLNLGLLIISFSCSKNKLTQKYDKQCLPGSVLIVSLGEELGKPKTPLLIRTLETDTTFFRYDVENNFENMEKMEFIFRKDVYFFNYIMDSKIFYLLKEYIITHNTHQNKTILNADYNTLKIVFFDHCDSLAYTVNKNDNGYFSNMANYIKVKDERLEKYFLYYQEIQNKDIEDR
jgi:hypothetical protein